MKYSSPHQSENLLTKAVGRLTPRPSLVFGAITLTALLAFEIFNFSTTDFALKDLLGDLAFAGMPWATILAVAFCAIDFAGIARLFRPQTAGDEPKEAWYLFGAWFLAATMNAILNWWGIAMAIAGHALQSTTVIDPAMLTTVVPVFVALMVWVIRILVIGSLTMAAEQWLASRSQPSTRLRATIPSRYDVPRPAPRPITPPAPVQPAPRAAATLRPAARRFTAANEPEINRPEPTYHSLTRSTRPSGRTDHPGGSSTRRM
ncbi:MAG TPA: hypothetical protein VFF68_09250 [Anaerolineaceae bacterium]|nr:hypothetical protein [Anaerolineaceae bacterium]